MISVLLGDDHAIVREGLRHLIEREHDLSVCAEGANGNEVLALMDEHHPDLVILDIAMPELSGLEALERIRTEHASVRTILLSVHAERPIVLNALALGADGYMLKDTRSSEIIQAIRVVMSGAKYFSPIVQAELVNQLFDPIPLTERPYVVLSGRERQVLQGLAEGLTAKAVASRLDIQVKTVEAHRTNLMRKTGLRKATELVRYAVRHGLIEP